MVNDLLAGGHRLRQARESCKLSLREVEKASERIASKYSSDEFLLSSSRISDFETKNIVPSIYKLYSFSVIYDFDYSELLSWYGIDLTRVRDDAEFSPNRVTHRMPSLLPSTLRLPTVLDPGFDYRKTQTVARFIQEWGVVPLAHLQQLVNRPYTYVHIGADDRTMYPLLMPGSFVQVDESQGYDVENWRSEYERPMYLVETREELLCCWCEMQKDKIVLQSHPLSGVPVRVMPHPQEAEIIGRVVGVAMSFSARHQEF